MFLGQTEMLMVDPIKKMAKQFATLKVMIQIWHGCGNDTARIVYIVFTIAVITIISN